MPVIRSRELHDPRSTTWSSPVVTVVDNKGGREVLNSWSWSSRCAVGGGSVAAACCDPVPSGRTTRSATSITASMSSAEPMVRSELGRHAARQPGAACRQAPARRVALAARRRRRESACSRSPRTSPTVWALQRARRLALGRVLRAVGVGPLGPGRTRPSRCGAIPAPTRLRPARLGVALRHVASS